MLLIEALGQDYRAAMNPVLREVGCLGNLGMQGDILLLGRWENVIFEDGVAALSQSS